MASKLPKILFVAKETPYRKNQTIEHIKKLYEASIYSDSILIFDPKRLPAEKLSKISRLTGKSMDCLQKYMGCWWIFEPACIEEAKALKNAFPEEFGLSEGSNPSEFILEVITARDAELCFTGDITIRITSENPEMFRLKEHAKKIAKFFTELFTNNTQGGGA